jgi:hypothetical protein
MESQRREGMISSNMTKTSGRKSTSLVIEEDLMGNTKKAWKLRGIRAAGDTGQTWAALVFFLLKQ